jgi:hypothetical protein
VLKFAIQFVLLLLPGLILAQVFFDVDQSVKVTATVSTTPSVITVNWRQDPRALSYDLYRREYQDSTWGENISSYPADVTQYIDADVQLHALYEYKVVKYVEGVEGYGYVLSGIERPAVHHAGELLIVITAGLVPLGKMASGTLARWLVRRTSATIRGKTLLTIPTSGFTVPAAARRQRPEV